MPTPPTRSHRDHRRQIWQLAWPMILANLSIPALGLADTAMLGHLSSGQFLSAAALGSSVLTFIFWSFGFLRMGTTGASAQADPSGSSAVLAKALMLGGILGLLIALLHLPLTKFALALINTPDSLRPLAEEYLSIRLLSAPAVLCSYGISGWLIGQRNTKAPLAIAVLINSLNILLDYLFIVQWQWQSAGAAWASVCSEMAGLVIGLVICRRALGELGRQGWRGVLQARQSGKQFLADNGRIFIRTAALLFGFLFFTVQGAGLGDEILAANAILLQLVMASAYGMDGFAHAAEALCGRAFGQRDRRAFFAMCRACAEWSLLSAALATLILALLKQPIIHTMTDLPALRLLAGEFYPWMLAFPLISVASYLFDGIFIGALRTQAMQWAMLLCVFGIYLPCWYLTQNWGNHGLWLSFACLNGSRSLIMLGLFLRLGRASHWQQSENNIQTPS
ncbi:MATE family efflux transporter [Spongiibacter taiwanensis]|uniref:MATE family efflux transporter n=1 Tax=Spongiibacter taiwanensis TaxID=1748242 RepID=UPI0020358226|nr:MATE family efflux transporter [Spongiibacter taiwanensis]USA41762.1 MATE family efflux transporter [Spongiibacter taiwanensis]